MHNRGVGGCGSPMIQAPGAKGPFTGAILGGRSGERERERDAYVYIYIYMYVYVGRYLWGSILGSPCLRKLPHTYVCVYIYIDIHMDR